MTACPDHGTDDLEFVEIDTVTTAFGVIERVDGTLLLEGGRQIGHVGEDRWIGCRSCSWEQKIDFDVKVEVRAA